MDFLEQFEEVCKRPGMYFTEPSYEVVAAFLLGFDLATQEGVLRGFREWLIVRFDGGNNLVWSELVLQLTFLGHSDPSARARESPQEAIDALFRLVREFSSARAEPDGMRRILLSYEGWLRRQDWYTPDSPGWVEIP